MFYFQLLSIASKESRRISVIVGTKSRKNIPLDTALEKHVRLMASSNVENSAKAVRVMELLTEVFEGKFMYARHLELICNLFRGIGQLNSSDNFGTYRSDLVVNLFATVVDLHNFEIVMRTLNAYEAACVMCRVGILNMFNPMKPEGYYVLEMSRYLLWRKLFRMQYQSIRLPCFLHVESVSYSFFFSPSQTRRERGNEDARISVYSGARYVMVCTVLYVGDSN